MRSNPVSVTQSRESSLVINQTLRNTYFLLSLTLLFSAGTAYWAMAANVHPLGIIPFLAGWFGLYFLTFYLRNSAWGILAVFAFTGFVGYTLGPILNLYIHQFSNGAQLIGTSLGATGLIFLCLSAYVLITRKDFNFMGGVITVTVLALMLMIIANVFLNIPALSLFISGAAAVIFSAYIMYTTSAIIHGGETNYIVATVSLYVALFNIFISLLQILGVFAGNRD
jgi:modulator of FtsH protease